MAFEVRTTVSGDGNSFIDVTYADAYFGDRGISTWTGADTAKQAALVQATDYIDARFASRFTNEVLEADSIPDKLKRATCEYAVRALVKPLAPDPAVDASGASVVTIRNKLGPLEKEFQVVGSGTLALFRPYPAADILLVGMIKPTANRVIR